jgi:hypothetical protein
VPNYNNIISNRSWELLGSGRLRISPYREVPDWVDIGPVDGIEFDEGLTISDIESDNTKPYKEVTKVEPTIKFAMFETLATRVRDIIRSGFDTKVVNPGTLITKSDEFPVSTVKASTLYPLSVQNANATKQTMTSVMEGTTPLVAGTDYEQAQGSDGNWGIIFNVDPTADIVVSYSVTPAASITYTTGANSELPYVMVWLYARNDGNPVDIVLFCAQIKQGDKLALQKDNAADRRAKPELLLVGTYDDLYHNGNTHSRTQRSGF